RVNVSYAGFALTADLGLAPDQFGFGVSMFFIAYLLFQYPHAQLMRVIGIRWWLFTAISMWGVSSFWMSQVQSVEGFYAARFLLGMAEAGFAPGMTWLVAQWTPVRTRGRAMAGVLVSVPLSMVLGGPLCGWLLGLDDPLGLPAWRAMFLYMAIPNFLLAIVAGLYFVEKPSQARWLSAEEKLWLQKELADGDRPDTPSAANFSWLKDAWLWRCGATWFLLMTGSYALVFWLPQLVRQLTTGSSELLIATLSAVPLAGLALGLLFNGWHSDRSGERLLHVGVPAALGGVALFVAAALPDGWSVLMLLTVAGFGIGAAQGVFWTVPPAMKIGGDRTPVGAIALISMAGTLGGIVGPWLIGKVLALGGSFGVAISLLALLLVLAFLPLNWRKPPTVAGAEAL
ncbi:MAG TPA: MFS transporter, partial [Pseudomonadaceae bacterium]|nr:MFS transporter [Pseudomonadaceae bacterium]